MGWGPTQWSVTGASAGELTTTETTPTFAGRTVSAQSTAFAQAAKATVTVIPAPGAGRRLELHGISMGGAAIGTAYLKEGASVLYRATTPGPFDFQGAKLSENTALSLEAETPDSTKAAWVTANYSVVVDET